MRNFTCAACGQMTFFENVRCVNCGHLLAYLPDLGDLAALEPSSDASTARELKVLGADEGRLYRLCENSTAHGVCNWGIPEDDPDPLCRACRLNDIIPDLSKPGSLEAWGRIELAKRRLLYTLYELGLPVESREERPSTGLKFSFMADGPESKVFTGHSNGLITINIAEADAPFREKMRAELGESYRTVLGHFRHEIGHYYWDRLISGTSSLAPFREVFGDEQIDYQQAVDRHYKEGAPSDWPSRFISAYATMHPWEDWAETWAHYLHIVDSLGTARAFGLALYPKQKARGVRAVNPLKIDLEDFDHLTASWIPLTVALNGLNRSMGLLDLYPFVLTPATLHKLRFVHEVIGKWRSTERETAPVRESAPRPAEAAAPRAG